MNGKVRMHRVKPLRAYSHWAICTVPEYVCPLKSRWFVQCEHAGRTQVQLSPAASVHSGEVCAQATVLMLMRRHAHTHGYTTYMYVAIVLEYGTGHLCLV